jgi:hypothetical protein
LFVLARTAPSEHCLLQMTPWRAPSVLPSGHMVPAGIASSVTCTSCGTTLLPSTKPPVVLPQSEQSAERQHTRFEEAAPGSMGQQPVGISFSGASAAHMLMASHTWNTPPGRNSDSISLILVTTSSVQQSSYRTHA